LPDQFRVPKREIQAEIVLFGQKPATLRIFLNEHAEGHTGFERPSDLFNGRGAFIPASEKKGGLVLLRRQAVTSVTVAADEEFSGGEPRVEDLAPDQATTMTVEILLEDASRAHGTITFLMPEGQRRLQDFLNLPDDFLVVRDGEHARLINKHRIARITIAGPR